MAAAVLGTSACILDLTGLSGGVVEVAGSDAAVGTDGAGPADAAVAHDADADAGAVCPGSEGPAGVRVSVGPTSFCIDATEVTKGQYERFLAAKGSDTSGQ